jgi:hypothetical protein
MRRIFLITAWALGTGVLVGELAASVEGIWAFSTAYLSGTARVPENFVSVAFAVCGVSVVYMAILGLLGKLPGTCKEPSRGQNKDSP